jgi:hypothetical protein
MLCGNCHNDNLPDAAFCSECGKAGGSRKPQVSQCLLITSRGAGLDARTRRASTALRAWRTSRGRATRAFRKAGRPNESGEKPNLRNPSRVSRFPGCWVRRALRAARTLLQPPRRWESRGLLRTTAVGGAGHRWATKRAARRVVDRRDDTHFQFRKVQIVEITGNHEWVHPLDVLACTRFLAHLPSR